MQRLAKKNVYWRHANGKIKLTLGGHTDILKAEIRGALSGQFSLTEITLNDDKI